MSDGPDLLERTRMALADCGIDPDLVQPSQREDSVNLVVQATDDELHWAWRALTLARWQEGHPGCCWTCVASFWADRSGPEPSNNCRAHLPLTEDCGVDR